MNVRRIANGTVVTAVLLFLALPILVIVVLSFSSATYLTFPPPAFGVRWYRDYFGSHEWLAATGLSLSIAAATVVLATSLGTLAALGLARLPPALRNLAAALILSPMIVPVIVVAIGIYYAYSRYGLVGTPVGLVLAHTCLAVPFVVTSVSASLAGFDRRLEQASLSLGATPWGTFRQVTLPRRMWDDLRFEIDPTIAAVSTLTIVLTAALLAVVHAARQRAERIRAG